MTQRVSPSTKSTHAKRGRGSTGPASNAQTGALPQTRKRPQRDPVDTIWNLFCSIRFAVALNVGLALAAALGTVIPQMSPILQNFSPERDRFLAAAAGRYGDFSNVLYWAGFYDLYSSLWFRMLLALTIFSIIICTLNRWQPIMRLISQPQVVVSETFMGEMAERAWFRSVPLQAGEAMSLVTAVLRKSRYRVLSEASEDGRSFYLYADRDRWSKLVTFVSHAGLVALILAAAEIANAGWREQSVYFYPGQQVNVGHGTEFSVRNDGFKIDYYSDGKSIKEYKQDLSVIEGGKVALTKTIVVNDPLNYRGINFFLSSYQSVAYIQAKGPAGEKIPFKELGASAPGQTATTEGATLVPFRAMTDNNLPADLVQFSVPGHAISLELKYYQDVARAVGENPPIYVRAYVDGNTERPIYDAFLQRTGPLRLAGYEQYPISFRKDTASILEVAEDPGLGLVTLFFMIMAGGFTLSLYTSFTRCWVRITPGEENSESVSILVSGLAEKNKVSFERHFEQLAGRIRDKLALATKNE